MTTILRQLLFTATSNSTSVANWHSEWNNKAD